MSVSASPDRPSERNEPLARRRKADFRLLWSATTVSQAGTQVSELAIPLAAILTLRAGALQVGVLAALGYLPALLFGLPAGVWADRLPRRVIMIAADLARLAVLASVPVAYALHALSLGQLYAVAFCVGALSVFFDVASPAYLPSLVPRDELAKANGRLQISEQGAAVFGPGLAGWLVGLIGAPVAIAIDAASYLASAAFISGIRHRTGPGERPPGTPRRQAVPRRPTGSTGQSSRKTAMRAQIGEGIRQVAASRQLRSIALAAAIMNLFGRLMVVLVPLYLVREGGYRPTAIGVIFACGSVGFLLGAAAADKVAARIGLGRAILAGGTVAALALLLIAVPPSALAGPFIAAAMFVYGIGALTFTISNATWRQLVTPDEMLGRVTAAMRLLTWAAQPIAALLAGWLGGQFGLHAALWVGAVGVLLAPIPLLTARLTAEPLGAQPLDAPAT